MAVNLSMLAGAGAQFFDNNGNPLAGGKLYTYAAGTTTPQATYTTSAGNVAHANPIVLDSAGRVPVGGEIWLTDAVNYKFVLNTSADVTLGTYDNVAGNASGILAALAASGGSALVGFLQAGTGAVARTAQSKMRDVVSVKDFGAAGDYNPNTGAGTDDTAAIQAAINNMAVTGGGLDTNPSVLLFPKGYYKISSSLTFPTGWVGNTIDLQGSRIYYRGSVDNTAAIFKITNNQFVRNTFLNGSLYCEDRCGYAFYAVGDATGYAVSEIVLDNINVLHPTVRAIQLGNYSVDGKDLDCANWTFRDLRLRLKTGQGGVMLDAPNCFNAVFINPFFGAWGAAAPNSYLSVKNAAGVYVYGMFTGDNALGVNPDNSDATPAVYLEAGGVSIVGWNTEGTFLLKTSGFIGERKNVLIEGVTVNDSVSSAIATYAIYAPVGDITLKSATLGKANIHPRKIYAGDRLTSENVYLGTNAAGTVVGKYELDYPGRCWIEGQHLSNVNIINGNPWLALWSGSSTGEYPYGYQSSGVGTFTVSRSVLNRNPLYSPYTALVAVTNGASSGNTIDGIQVRVPLIPSNKSGTNAYAAVARGVANTLVGTTTVQLRIAFWDALGNFVAGNFVNVTPDGSGLFEAYVSQLPGSFSAAYMTATVGLGVAGASGNIYLNNLSILPFMDGYTVNGGEHWRTIADVWTKYPKAMAGNLEYIRAGILAAGPGGALSLMTWASAAPTNGNWRQGDVVWNTSATAGGSPGWVCVTAGNPGTWKAMANLAP